MFELGHSFMNYYDFMSHFDDVAAPWFRVLLLIDHLQVSVLQFN
jgi:hypothetical protein